MSSLDLSRIIFEVTASCDQDCLYCYNIWKGSTRKSAFPLDFEKANQTLKRLFSLAKVEHITFSGGEPLFLERLPELVLYARMKGARVNLITAGYRKTRFSDALPDLDISLFQLPYHSHLPEVHDQMAGRAGAHAKVLSAIQFYRKSQAEIAAVIVLTRLNASHLRETISSIRSLGIRRLLVNRFNPGGRGLHHRDELELNPADLNAAFRVLNDAADEQLHISSGVNTPFCLLDPREYPRLSFAGCRVWEGKGPITLDAPGNLRLCNHSPRSLGNIHTDSLETIARAPVFLTWQKAVPQECRECNLFHFCRGGCRASAEQMGASAIQVDPYWQKYSSHVRE